jgi:hypothetical protein
MRFCSATKQVFAAVMVSFRMKFWSGFIHDGGDPPGAEQGHRYSNERLGTGIASLGNQAGTQLHHNKLIARSSCVDARSITCVNLDVKSVRAETQAGHLEDQHAGRRAFHLLAAAAGETAVSEFIERRDREFIEPADFDWIDPAEHDGPSTTRAANFQSVSEPWAN